MLHAAVTIIRAIFVVVIVVDVVATTTTATAASPTAAADDAGYDYDDDDVNEYDLPSTANLNRFFVYFVIDHCA